MPIILTYSFRLKCWFQPKLWYSPKCKYCIKTERNLVLSKLLSPVFIAISREELVEEISEENTETCHNSEKQDIHGKTEETVSTA